MSFSQLLACGFSHDEIATMSSRGQLIALYRGVYALGHRRLTMPGRLKAGLLAAGSGAFLSHRVAAAHRGLCAHPRTIELTVPGGHTAGRRAELHIHRTTIPADRTQVRPHNGLPTATVPRIVVDLAPRETSQELQRLIRQAIRIGQFDLAELRAQLGAHPRRPGVALARRALARYLPGSESRRSTLEAAFQGHERADPRLPTPQYNVHLFGYEVDVAWFEQRVTLELDGRPYHVAVEDFDRDRAKDRTLTRHLWRPLRVSDAEWEHDRRRVLEDLYGVLGV